MVFFTAVISTCTKRFYFKRPASVICAALDVGNCELDVRVQYVPVSSVRRTYRSYGAQKIYSVVGFAFICSSYTAVQHLRGRSFSGKNMPPEDAPKPNQRSLTNSVTAFLQSEALGFCHDNLSQFVPEEVYLMIFQFAILFIGKVPPDVH